MNNVIYISEFLIHREAQKKDYLEAVTYKSPDISEAYLETMEDGHGYSVQKDKLFSIN